MPSNTLTRAKFVCDGSTIRLIEEHGEPGDIVLSYRKPMIDGVSLAQEMLGYKYPATEIRHAAMYIGDGKVIHAYPITSTSMGGIRIERLGVGFRDKTISLLRYASINNPDFELQRQNLVKVAQETEGKSYNYYELIKIGSESVSKIWQKEQNLRKTKFKANKYTSEAELNQYYTCASLIFGCYDIVFGERNPLNDPEYALSPYLVPAMFYINRELVDARIENGKLCF